MIYTAYYQSPIGCIRLDATDIHLCHASYESTPPSQFPVVTSLVLQKTISQLTEYFAGKRKVFELPLQQTGTEFQQKVWNELLRIPYGEQISYKELATRVGNQKACRAAGSANGKNQIFIIVPCHRVVQADGGIGGYAYGPDMKQFLLNLEQK